MPATHYDYVIVGAGAAGCAVANRLSADPDRTVLLLEAGGRDWSPLVHRPVGSPSSAARVTTGSSQQCRSRS